VENIGEKAEREILKKGLCPERFSFWRAVYFGPGCEEKNGPK
jgi:hypothetical protein